MVMKSILGVTVLKISCNGLGIAEGRDFENQMFNLAMKFNSSTKVQLTTSAPILAMQC